MTGSGSSDRYVVISCDSHAGANIPDYRPYLPDDFHEEFDAWASEFSDSFWGTIDVEQLDTDDRNLRVGIASFMSPYNWDSSLRSEHFEAEGVVGEVIFPNTVPPFYPCSILGAPAPTTATEYRLYRAGLMAHNRWLVDFCAELPGRRAGLVQIFLDDLDDAIADIRWARKVGLAGVLLPADHVRKLVPLHEYRLDPFWDVCAELDLPLHRHGGINSDAETPETGPQAPAVGMWEGAFFVQRALGHLIVGGVLDRHPDLKFVFTETGNNWVPDVLASMDAWCQEGARAGSVLYPFAHRAIERLSLTPTEYFRRNCYIGASLMEDPVLDMRYDVGVDHIMWGADYPHHEGTFPHTDVALRLNFSRVPEPEIRTMTSEVAARLYGFDLGFLQTIADRVGPTVERIATPVSDDEVPRHAMNQTFREAERKRQLDSVGS
jgi:predicted TIM-barrel fold metal-dependent hydrolase